MLRGENLSERRRAGATVIALLLVVSVLGAVPLVAVADDPEGADSPENANALDVAVGSSVTVTGTLGPEDADWYAVEAERGELIRVNMTRLGDQGDRHDVGLYQRDPSADDGYAEVGNGHTESRVFNGDTAHLGFVPPADGTYLVWAGSNCCGDVEGNYELTVRRAETDSFEPNDDPANATRLFENPFGNVSGDLHPADAEWFRYDLGAGQSITVTATRPASNNNRFETALGRLDPDDPGTVDGPNTPAVWPGATETFSYESSSPTPTYLGIFEDSGGTFEAAITVDGDPVGLPNDRYERPNPPIGNQDPANATALASGTYTDLGMVDDDRDVFAVELTAYDRLHVTSTFAQSENDLALAITDGSGTTLGSVDSANDNEELAVTVPSEGTYYVAVNGTDGAATRYDLAVDVTRRVNVTVGPDSELAVAENGTLTVGVTNPGDATVDGVEVAATGTDGLVVDPARREIGRLAGGETRTVEFTIRGNASGEKTVAISVATEAGGTVRVSSISGLGTSFEQTGELTDEPPDGPTPTAETGSTEPSQGGTPADGTGAGTATSGDGPGFGAGSGLVAVAILVYLLGRRG